ncbi:hypothetical protein J7L09_00600 [bacterium]|nr:hypothetical protein [bacterium]
MKKQLYDIEWQINKILFKLSIFVTVVAMLMMLIEFFSRGAFPSAKIGTFYIGILLIYSLHKEALRWISEKDWERGQRKGEYFVYAWIVLTTILYLINFLTKDYFNFDAQGNKLIALSEITVTALEVGGVFIFTRILKLIFSILYGTNKNRKRKV